MVVFTSFGSAVVVEAVVVLFDVVVCFVVTVVVFNIVDTLVGVGDFVVVCVMAFCRYLVDMVVELVIVVLAVPVGFCVVLIVMIFDQQL